MIFCYQVFIFVECLARASRHILLSGDWLSQEKVSRDYLEALLKKCLTAGAGKKEVVEGVLSLAQKPWDSPRVKNLLTGKTELQQQGFTNLKSLPHNYIFLF